LQGDTDPLVPYPNAELIVGQYLASDDWADDGENNGSIERSASDTEMGQVPDSHSYEIDTYVDESGCILVQRWLINGMGHAWSQGVSTDSPRDALLVDPLGPELRSATLDFIMAHPKPASMGCS